MKPIAIAGALFLLSLTAVSGAFAYFIGDDVIFEYYTSGILRDTSGPDPIFIQEGPDETDTVVLASKTALLDMDSDRFILNMVRNNGIFGSALFSGFKVVGLENTENPDWILLGVDIETDLAGWTDDRFETTADENGLNLWFNLEGMSLPSGSSLTAVFEFGPNPIPIPATAALFVTGLIGFAIVRKRIRD
ncbi:MAG TPA: hypothetical protein ACFCUC_04890 [Desulfobacterales bacterium]